MGKKLQIALDVATKEKALQVLEQVHNSVDIIELGTPLLVAEGMHVVRAVRQRYPNAFLFADTKIMDAGSIIAEIAFEAGADMVSVAACTEDNTIEAAIKLAHQKGKLCLVDMVAVRDIPARAPQVEAMGPDYVCTHIGWDIRWQHIDPVDELGKLSGIRTPKAIAGGIDLSMIPKALKSDADIIVVGEGIYGQPNMAETAHQMHELLAAAN